MSFKNVVYLSDQQTPFTWELYRAPLTGPAQDGVKLNGSLVTGGNVEETFQISPESGWVIYLANQDTNDVIELFITWERSLYLPVIVK